MAEPAISIDRPSNGFKHVVGNCLIVTPWREKLVEVLSYSYLLVYLKVAPRYVKALVDSKQYCQYYCHPHGYLYPY